MKLSTSALLALLCSLAASISASPVFSPALEEHDIFGGLDHILPEHDLRDLDHALQRPPSPSSTPVHSPLSEPEKSPGRQQSAVESQSLRPTEAGEASRARSRRPSRSAGLKWHEDKKKTSRILQRLSSYWSPVEPRAASTPSGSKEGLERGHSVADLLQLVPDTPPAQKGALRLGEFHRRWLIALSNTPASATLTHEQLQRASLRIWGAAGKRRYQIKACPGLHRLAEVREAQAAARLPLRLGIPHDTERPLLSSGESSEEEALKRPRKRQKSTDLISVAGLRKYRPQPPHRAKEVSPSRMLAFRKQFRAAARVTEQPHITRQDFELARSGLWRSTLTLKSDEAHDVTRSLDELAARHRGLSEKKKIFMKDRRRAVAASLRENPSSGQGEGK